jgi:hypothetical protein
MRVHDDGDGIMCLKVPESKIDARRHSRGHLRHLVPPEALGLAGHDKPVPHLKVNRKRVLRSPVPEPKLACCPERQAGLLSDNSQGQAHRRCATQRCRARFDKGCIAQGPRHGRARRGSYFGCHSGKLVRNSVGGIDTLTQYSRSRSRFGLAAAMVESGYGRANDIDK